MGRSWDSRGSGIKCLLGSAVNVSNLTLLGSGGGDMTQATRGPGPINILGPGASPALSRGRGLRAKGSCALEGREGADSSCESLCDLEQTTPSLGLAFPFQGALGGISDPLPGCWEACWDGRGLRPSQAPPNLK